MNSETILIALKWISQALIAVVGIWGLLSDPYEKDGATGRRRLTKSGWLKVALLGVGFCVFAATDVNERQKRVAQRQQQAAQLVMQTNTIAKQEKSLDYLRELILLQHRLSEIELSLRFPEPAMKTFLDSIMKPKETNPPKADPTRLAYVSTACRSGNAVVRYEAYDQGYLDYSINRPQGFIAERIHDTDPVWRAFVSAFHELVGGEFTLLSDAGRTLVNVLEPERPVSIRFQKEDVIISLRDPGLRLDELRGNVSVICGKDKLLFTHDGDEEGEAGTPERMRFGPASLRLLSKDPRVAWDQEITFRWEPVVTRKLFEVELDKRFDLGYWHSRDHKIEARLSSLGPE